MDFNLLSELPYQLPTPLAINSAETRTTSAQGLNMLPIDFNLLPELLYQPPTPFVINSAKTQTTSTQGLNALPMDFNLLPELPELPYQPPTPHPHDGGQPLWLPSIWIWRTPFWKHGVGDGPLHAREPVPWAISPTTIFRPNPNANASFMPDGIFSDDLLNVPPLNVPPLPPLDFHV
ncbi:hypothetical protein BDK51DRAFT_33927 [Blyttiomyces helicus]|uniref:Uncharacterized protein n=1 Tax=Blyttiomyces helicus TaxID=388810 RepID=A0A4P9VVP7_9FUNG|nr:hypothetical protein BDK51DRAFT_33927 [Blyttiomyces helicus]|eukprot:RKO82713.1 hypothetical protein BDK51DRAFT_33927 [Blyttiomyces helicus]